MTLNPLVHPLLLLLIGSGLVALVLVAMRAAPKDGRGMWLGRLLVAGTHHRRRKLGVALQHPR